MAVPGIAPEDIEQCARMLKKGTFGLWLGFGARKAAPLVQELVKRTDCRVFCSPRAKGIVPEDHPRYLGVTGLGGHEEVTEFMVRERPLHVLVLGTRLGEATSFWDRDLVPRGGFLHVDIDPEVAGTAYPDSETFGVHAEIGQFLKALLEYFPKNTQEEPVDINIRRAERAAKGRKAENVVSMTRESRGPVRPRIVMEALQRRVVEESDAVVLAECGNSFAWCNHYLRFPQPERYRVSTLFGSMGHTAAGVVGAALARKGKAVTVVGDGSMLMNSEISTAAQYGAQAVWIILNDAAYGMCRDGHQALGLTDAGVHFPRVDFVRMASALGADGVLVEDEADLDRALDAAMEAEGPFVVDVRIDPTEASPLLQRFESLIKQGNSKNVAGWER
jgi:acetolactate synthase-1/2/3 large subunit